MILTIFVKIQEILKCVDVSEVLSFPLVFLLHFPIKKPLMGKEQCDQEHLKYDK